MFVKIYEYNMGSLTEIINGIDSYIEFLIEPDSEGKLPFLDLCINVKDVGCINITIYSKPIVGMEPFAGPLLHGIKELSEQLSQIYQAHSITLIASQGGQPQLVVHPKDNIHKKNTNLAVYMSYHL